MAIILIVLALGALIVFHDYTIPFLRRVKDKVHFWFIGIKFYFIFKKMSKKYKDDPKLQKDLINLANLSRNIHKDINLNENEE